MKRLSLTILFLLFTCLYAYGDTEVVGAGGGVSEGSDVGFGNITAITLTTSGSVTTGSGSAAAPAIDVGGVNTGLYESGNNLSITVAGVGKAAWSAGYLSTSGWLIYYGGAITAIQPAYTFPGDADTGIGRAGVDQLSLTAGEVEALRNYTTYSEFYPSGSGQVRVYDNGNLEAEGNVIFSGMTTIFSDYSAINNMNQILCDATTGDIDIHIVSASGAKGRIGNVKKIDASGNNCIIEPAGAETIDGVANRYISTQWENLTFFSDNTNLLIR